MDIRETLEALKELRRSHTELLYSEGLEWYYQLVIAGNDAIARYDYEELTFMEDWRRDIKRVMS